MFRNRLIAAAVATTLAVPAAALARTAPVDQPPVATGAAAAVAQTADSGREKRYCIREALTGTRIVRDFCKTRTQWLRQGLDPIAKY